MRLRGLDSRVPSRTSRVPGRYDDTASSLMELAGANAIVNQSSRWPNTFAAGEIREPKDRRDNKARQRVRRGELSTTEYVFGEASEKKKVKAPVAEDDEIDSSEHSSAESSSNTPMRA